MAAVSRKVMPVSMAASITARVPATSVRRPKLLQPRPTTVTSGPASPSRRVGRGESLMRCRLVSVGSSIGDPVVVAAQRVGETPRYRGILALLPQRGDHQLVALGTADIDDPRAVEIPDEDRAAIAPLDPAGGVG